jgi:hypothetical protein
MRKPTKKAFEAYQQKVDERLAVLKETFEALVDAIETVDRNAVKNSVDRFVTSADHLKEILPSETWPNWLASLRNRAKGVVKSPDDARFLRALTSEVRSNLALARDFDWAFDPTEAGAPSLATILKDEIGAKDVNGKFDSIIQILVQVVQCDGLDRQKAYSDLLTILAMLREAKTGGYAEKIFTWNFVKRFVPNLLVETARSTPGVKQCLNAFKKTAEELDVSFDEIKNAVADRFYLEVERAMESKVEFCDPVALLTDQSLSGKSGVANASEEPSSPQ